MSICAICRFPAVPDDVVLHGPGRQCVCLHCYLRETGVLRPVPAPLRRQVGVGPARGGRPFWGSQARLGA